MIVVFLPLRAHDTISLSKIPNCASISLIKYSPSGKYIFIADQERQAFLITNTGDVVHEWRYSDMYYDSVWNKQPENQLTKMKIFGSIERSMQIAEKVPEEYRQRFLDNFKPCRKPAIVPPKGLVIQNDTLELPTGKDRQKMMAQKFDNAYFANDTLLYISATIPILAIDTFGFTVGSMPQPTFSKCYSIIEFTLPNKRQRFQVLKYNFDRKTYPMECPGTFTSSDRHSDEFFCQIEFDTEENVAKFLKKTDFSKIGAVGLFDKKTSELKRTYGSIPECYRYDDIIYYASSELLTQPKGKDTLDIIYPLWDSVQVCKGSNVYHFPLHITPNNDTMFTSIKNRTTEGFLEIYAKKNFYISKMERTTHNTTILIIQQRQEKKQRTWLVREYDDNWKIIKEKRIEDSIGGNKIYYTGYKALDNTICYVTMDTNENWQLHSIPF